MMNIILMTTNGDCSDMMTMVGVDGSGGDCCYVEDGTGVLVYFLSAKKSFAKSLARAFSLETNCKRYY